MHTHTANSLSCSGFSFGPQAFPDLVLKNNQRNSTRKSHGAHYNHNSRRSRLWLQPSFRSCRTFIHSGLICGLILARIWIQTQLESQIKKKSSKYNRFIKVGRLCGNLNIPMAIIIKYQPRLIKKQQSMQTTVYSSRNSIYGIVLDIISSWRWILYFLTYK